jgi:MFS family permease
VSPPVGRRGERLFTPRLGLAFACMLFVSGVPNTFTVFFPPLLEEFGGTRAATASASTLLWVVSAVLGPVAGQLVDRWSPRLVVVLGLAGAALGLGGAAVAPTLGVFLACLGVGVGIGVGLSGIVSQAAVIAETYVARRGFASGIAFAGSMAGYAIATPAHWAIAAFGWRATLVAWALVVVALIPGVLAAYPERLAARARTAGAGAAADRRLRDVLASVPFWALAVTFAFAPMVGYVMTIQHTLYFASLGFPASEAATMLAVGGVLAVVGRTLSGLGADRFGAARVTFVTFGITLAGALCLTGLELWPGRVLAYAYVLLVFLTIGSRAPLFSVLAIRLTTPATYGRVFGCLVFIQGVGAGAGPFISGGLYDLTGSYLAVDLAAVAILVLALASLTAFVVTVPPERLMVEDARGAPP